MTPPEGTAEKGVGNRCRNGPKGAWHNVSDPFFLQSMADPLSFPARGTPMSQQNTSQPAVPHDRPRFKALPPYKVILHHDGASELMFVVIV